MQPVFGLHSEASPIGAVAHKVRSMVNHDYASPDLFDLLYTRPSSGTGAAEYPDEDQSAFKMLAPKTIPQGLQAQINSILYSCSFESSLDLFSLTSYRSAVQNFLWAVYRNQQSLHHSRLHSFFVGL